MNSGEGLQWIGWEEREYWVRKGSGADEWTFEMGIWCIYIVPFSSAQFIYYPPKTEQSTD
jgi:hypothetical protein